VKKSCLLLVLLAMLTAGFTTCCYAYLDYVSPAEKRQRKRRYRRKVRREKRKKRRDLRARKKRIATRKKQGMTHMVTVHNKTKVPITVIVPFEDYTFAKHEKTGRVIKPWGYAQFNVDRGGKNREKFNVKFAYDAFLFSSDYKFIFRTAKEHIFIEPYGTFHFGKKKLALKLVGAMPGIKKDTEKRPEKKTAAATLDYANYQHYSQTLKLLAHSWKTKAARIMEYSAQKGSNLTPKQRSLFDTIDEYEKKIQARIKSIRDRHWGYNDSGCERAKTALVKMVKKHLVRQEILHYVVACRRKGKKVNWKLVHEKWPE